MFTEYPDGNEIVAPRYEILSKATNMLNQYDNAKIG